MAFPLLAVGARLLGGAAKKVAGKALRWATKGRLLGSGGGRELAKRVVQGAGAVAGTAVVTRATNAVITRRDPTYGGQGIPDMSNYDMLPSGEMVRVRGGKRYRRINPANGRALRRAMRRLDAAEKIFKKVFRFNHGKAPTNVRLRGK
jgi:hypothetical protein